LHGCIGLTGHFTGIADRLSSWEYVALAVDSLGPRGVASRCGVGSLDQAFDAYAGCDTCRSRFSSIRRGSPFSASRWAVLT
jgi:dienelactone hydrolase